MSNEHDTTRYDFVEYTEMAVPKKGGGLTASLNRRGELALNRPAMEALGRPPAMILFYDADRMVIGVRPTWNLVDHAIAIRSEQSGRHNRVPMSKFLEERRIRPAYTIRFLDAVIQNEMLILDLNRTIRVEGSRTIQKRRREAALAETEKLKRGRKAY